MDMKRRILSCFLAFCMIFALLPAPAQAAGNAENATPTVTATVQHAATGQITAQIEAYMTDSANKTRTVKPCDIIFLIEQSKFMNTQNGSASSGDERAEILSAIDRLLDGMPQPTTGGAHRIAIAGYGRINNPGRSDGYNAALYPGTLPSSNDSLNTGYYTKDGTKVGFHSQSGWTEWNKIDGHTDATLPQLPSGYLTNTDGTDGYDDVFLTVSDAKQVIDADKMVPWYAGAARMDAGLTITEQLAKIAKAEADSKDRNLIVCIAASSLPYQNSGTYQKLRPDAAIEAANTLKKTYGATIFGLGDFNKLNLGDSESLNDPDKQRKNFNDTMASICGNTSAHGADYFKGLSQVHDIDEALNELMTKIDANVGEGAAEELSIDVDSFTEGAGGYSWSQLKDGHHILSAGSIREVASVDYYRFTGYDDNGTPLFASTPSRHTEQSLADIGRGNAIQTSLNILPIPPAGAGRRDDQGRELRREGRHHHHRPGLHRLCMDRALDAAETCSAQTRARRARNDAQACRADAERSGRGRPEPEIRRLVPPVGRDDRPGKANVGIRRKDLRQIRRDRVPGVRQRPQAVRPLAARDSGHVSLGRLGRPGGRGRQWHRAAVRAEPFA